MRVETAVCGIVVIGYLLYFIYVAEDLTSLDNVYRIHPLSEDEIKEKITRDNYFKYDGSWIPGRHRNSIPQYEDIRRMLFIFVPLILVHLAISNGIQYIASKLMREAFKPRVLFNLVLSLIFLYVLHGNNLLWIMLLTLLGYALINYSIKASTANPSLWYLPHIVCWGYSMLLFTTVCTNSYSYSWFDAIYKRNYGDEKTPVQDMEMLQYILHVAKQRQGFIQFGSMYRLCVVRMISFFMDYTWTRESPNPKEEQEYYSCTNYLFYVLYVPLYLTGPVCTFNNFIARWLPSAEVESESRKKELYPLYTNSEWWREYFKSFAKFIAFALVLDVFTHFCYFNNYYYQANWDNMSPTECYVMIYTSAFLFFWGRYYCLFNFSRLWANLDCSHYDKKVTGPDEEPMYRFWVPCDMPLCSWQCTSLNRYSLETWHLSLADWALRYIYVPLGGTNRAYLGATICFVFSGTVHGITLEMLSLGIIKLYVPFLIELAFRMWCVKHVQGKTDLYVERWLLVLLNAFWNMTIVAFQFLPMERSASELVHHTFIRGGIGPFMFMYVFFVCKVVLNYAAEDNWKSDSIRSYGEWNLVPKMWALGDVQDYQSNYNPIRRHITKKASSDEDQIL